MRLSFPRNCMWSGGFKRCERTVYLVVIGSKDLRREGVSFERWRRDINARDSKVSDRVMLIRICTRSPCPMPCVSITLMRYIPARKRAKVQISISRKDGGRKEVVGRQKSIAFVECRAAYMCACTRGIHKLSSHYRSPRNTLYACKTAKTNAVPTTRTLRTMVMCPGPDTVVRGFYTYGESLMKRGQLCQLGADYLVEGPRR